MYSSNTNLNNSTSSSPQQQKQQRQRHASPIRKLSPFRRSGKSKSPQRQQSPAPPQQSTVASSAATMVRERADRQSTARSERSDHFSDNNKKQQQPRGLFRNNKRLDSSQSSPDNREPRRFEEERQIRQRGQVRSRFFGQQEVSDGAEGSDEAAQSVRPPPDMRRLLLNNVNLTRSKSMSKDLDQRSSVIRAI